MNISTSTIYRVSDEVSPRSQYANELICIITLKATAGLMGQLIMQIDLYWLLGLIMQTSSFAYWEHGDMESNPFDVRPLPPSPPLLTPVTCCISEEGPPPVRSTRAICNVSGVVVYTPLLITIVQ